MSVRERVVQPRGFGSILTEAWISLVVAAGQATDRIDEVCLQHGITGEQYNVLRILRGAHPDGHPRAEVTGRLIRRSPDVTRLLDRLEAKQLIERTRSDGDRRLSIARITSSGLELLTYMDPQIRQAMEELMAPLSEAQMRQLSHLCNALIP